MAANVNANAPIMAVICGISGTGTYLTYNPSDSTEKSGLYILPSLDLNMFAVKLSFKSPSSFRLFQDMTLAPLPLFILKSADPSSIIHERSSSN